MTFDEAFAKLARSKFRSCFKLSETDRKYIAEKGLETIRRHAVDFVRQKLAPAQPPNDGKQTPMRGHPVFKAQHGTATCCRGCMNKWECAEERSSKGRSPKAIAKRRASARENASGRRTFSRTSAEDGQSYHGVD